MEKQQVLHIVKEAVLDFDMHAEVYLFGSRARGDFYEESDWDFLVLINDGENFIVRDRLREKLFYKELETGEIFSLIVHSKEYWEKLQLSYFYKEVTKDGIKI